MVNKLDLSVQSFLGKLINFSLFALLGAAWIAGKFPAYDVIILSIVVTVGLLISATSVLAARANVNSRREKIRDGANSTQEPKITPLLFRAAHGSVAGGAYIFPTMRGDVRTFHSPLSREPSSELYQRILQQAVADIRRSESDDYLIDLSAGVPDSYTVRVGMVTVSIKNGHADIRVGSKHDEYDESCVGRRVFDEKIDVILRPDLTLN